MKQGVVGIIDGERGRKGEGFGRVCAKGDCARREDAALKDRFDKQQIINEQLMQNAMKKDVRRLFLSKKSVPLGIALVIVAFVVIATLYMTSLNISTEMMWRRGILIALLCVGTIALEYHSAKRLIYACDDIIEYLKMKDKMPQYSTILQQGDPVLLLSEMSTIVLILVAAPLYVTVG